MLFNTMRVGGYMSKLSDLAELLEVLQLLEAEVPFGTPAREEVIRKAAHDWLMERRRVRRLTTRR